MPHTTTGSRGPRPRGRGSDLTAELDVTSIEIQKVIRRLTEEMQERSGTLARIVARMIESNGMVARNTGVPSLAAPPPPRSRRMRDDGEVVREATVQREDGKHRVMLTITLSLLLRPAETALLFVLADDAGESVDDLVPWKTRDEIRGRLGTQGRPLSRGALNQRLSCLQTAFGEIGIDFLILKKGDCLRLARPRGTPVMRFDVT